MKLQMNSFFEEMSQVLFFKNLFFGMIFLILCLSFNSHIFLCGTGCALIGFIYSRRDRTPKILKNSGLLTINGFFFGIALASLFKASIPFYASLIIGALVLPMATKATFEILQHWKLSPFIISYIIVAWIFYLSADALSLQLENQKDLSEPIAAWLNSRLPGWPHLFEILLSIFASMGRVFFLPNPIFGLALFTLVLIGKPRKGIYFFVGAATATIAGFLLGISQSMFMDLSHFSFSAGLVGLGLASLPEEFEFERIFVFCLFSLFVTLAASQLLTRLGLPVLSLPYVITLWTALLSRSPRLNVSWARQH